MSKVLTTEKSRIVWALTNTENGYAHMELFETRADAVRAKRFRRDQGMLAPLEVHKSSVKHWRDSEADTDA